MTDEGKKGWDGRGAHSTEPAWTGKSRDQMMADFKAEMKAKKRRRIVDFTPEPKDTKPEDYPWMKAGWRW